MCRPCTWSGSTCASDRERKSACFWLFPSSATRSPGTISASSASTIWPVASTLPSSSGAMRSSRSRLPLRSTIGGIRPSLLGTPGAAARTPAVRCGADLVMAGRPRKGTPSGPVRRTVATRSCRGGPSVVARHRGGWSPVEQRSHQSCSSSSRCGPRRTSSACSTRWPASEPTTSGCSPTPTTWPPRASSARSRRPVPGLLGYECTVWRWLAASGDPPERTRAR